MNTRWLDPQLAGARPPLDPDEVVDDELVVVMRNRIDDALGPALGEHDTVDTVEIVDHRVPVPGRSEELAVVIRSPKSTGPSRPCVFWIHGGGYVAGSAFHRAPRLDRWCLEHDAVVVSPDYRLAPEHPYPRPLDDCFAALRWTLARAGELGIDPARVVLAGSSAGGGLAAATSLRARDAGLWLAGVMLVAPMIDDRTVEPPGVDDAPVWTYAKNALGWRSYLGREHSSVAPDERNLPPEAAVARATDLSGLPSTFIGVGTVDIFLAEDLAYVKALVEAGVEVEAHVYAGGHHGFDNHAPDAAVVRRINRDLDDWLRRALASGST